MLCLFHDSSKLFFSCYRILFIICLAKLELFRTDLLMRLLNGTQKAAILKFYTTMKIVRYLFVTL